MGVHDTLVVNGSPISSYDVITKSQIKYRFSGNSLYFYLTSISDESGNTITINRANGLQVSSIVDPTGRSLTINKDSSGRATSVTDFTGRQWTFQYDATNTNGNLTQINYPSVSGQNYNVQFGYDGSHNITRFQNKRGNASTFGYNTADGSNSLAWGQDSYGSRTTYTYGASSTTITNANGHSIVHTYDAYGHLSAVTDAAGKTEYYTAYDANNNLTQKKDRRGFLWNYTYDSMGNQLTASDPYSATTTATFNSHNKPLTQTDALANKTTLTYDGQDNPLTATVTSAPGASAFQATSQTSGYTNGLPSTVTDPLNHSTTLGYDGNGYVINATDANNITTSATYNALGWKLTSTDGLGYVTRYTYDNWGRVTAVTAPDNTVTSTVYDPNGNVLRVSDANATPLTLSGSAAWGSHSISFNGAGGATAGNAALGNFGTSDFTVGAWIKLAPGQSGYLFSKRIACMFCNFWEIAVGHTVGILACQDGSSGGYLSFWGSRPIDDNAWHYLSVVHSGAQFSIYIDGTLDTTQSGPVAYNFSNAASLRVADSVCCGPGGNGSLRFVGQLGEVRLYNRGLGVAEIAGLAQNAPPASAANQLQSSWNFNEGSGSVAYDACHSVVNTYDADDRLIQTTNGRGDVVTYTYDGPSGLGSPDRNGQTQRGLLSSKTDGNGHTTFYSYTARNEPSATYYPDGTQESITYDENGNTLTRTKPDGKVISYAYDPDNRLTDITYPTLHPTHFGYDADGRRTLMTDATGTTNWTYGDGLHLGVLVSPVGGVSYWYDADGRRTAMEGFVNGIGDVSYWYYGYDNGGRLLTLRSTTDGTTTFTYDGASRLIRKTKGNADFETYSYDAASQLTDIGYWWADGTSRNFHSYTYTAAGSLLTDDQWWYKTTYGYDGADHLTRETGSNGYPPLSYTYDHNGNRLTQTNNGSVVQQFSYDAHDKLTSGTAGNESDTYDLNGNETRLTLGGSVYQFVYDEEDRLVQGLYPGVTDTFTYNGLGLRVGKQDSTGSYSYLCDGASPASPVLWDGQAVYTAGLSERRGGVSSFSDFDRLGNLWTVDGAAGAVQLYYQDTTGFGTPLSAAGNVGTPFRFGGGNGCQTDADIGLVLMGHRYYDTRIGRFISQDPAGDGDNWYAYAGNDPVNGTDPSGLKMKPIGNGYWEDENTGQVAFGLDGADLSGDSISADGSHIDTGTTTIHGGGGGDDPGPSVWQDAWAGAQVGFAAVGSAASFHLWDGGAARHDPSFGVSRGLADVGVMAGTAAFGGAAGTLGNVERSGQTLVTHWDTEEGLANIAKNGLKEGAWLMKGKPSIFKWIRTGKFLNYKSSIVIESPDGFLTTR